MDNWNPMRDFWTLEGAKKFYREHKSSANVFHWDGEQWQWVCGACDLDPALFAAPRAS
jgi:hypothetical protein